MIHTLVRLSCVLLLCFAAQPVSGEAQWPPFVSLLITWQTEPASQQNPVVPEPGTALVYLPLILQPPPPPTTIRFGATFRNGALGEEGTSFAFGLQELHYQISVRDGVGRSFREEWIVDGQRQPALDRSGTIPPESVYLGSAIALSTSNPLPRGTYQLRFFVDGQLAAQGQAVIR